MSMSPSPTNTPVNESLLLANMPARPKFTIVSGAEADFATSILNDAVRRVAPLVKGSRAKDFDNGRIKGLDALVYEYDKTLLALMRTAINEIASGEISATSLELIRCEIGDSEMPSTDAWMPKLPDFGGRYFKANRPTSLDPNAAGRLLLADNHVAFKFSHSSSHPACDNRDPKEFAITISLRMQMSDQMIRAYAQGATYYEILHGFQQAIITEPSLVLNSSGFAKKYFSLASLLTPNGGSAIRMEINESFNCASRDLIMGIEPIIKLDEAYQTERLLDPTNINEKELGNLCSRALIEELLHSVQTLKFSGDPKNKTDRERLCLSSLTIAYIKASGDSLYDKPVRSKMKFDPGSIDDAEAGLTRLMEVDVLAYFIEQWNKHGISQSDLQPEMTEFHPNFRKPFVAWLATRPDLKPRQSAA